MPELSESLTAFTLKVNRSRIEENKLKAGKKIALSPEQPFFDKILRASGSKRRRSGLVVQDLTEKGHGPIRMMQGDTIDSGNCVISSPLVVTRPIRPRYKEPMQNCEEESTLYIKFKLSIRKQAMDNRRQAKFLPESLEDQCRADFDGMGCDIDFAGKNQQGLLRKSGQRADKGFHTPFGLKLIKATNGCDDALADFAADLVVFDDLQVLVPAGFFDSCKHSGLLC
ncbi:MAG: hypothetical protein WA946_11810 [Nitrospirota bacterium]